MTTPKKPRKKKSPATPPQQIGTLKIRVEEGLTRDARKDGELSDAELDGVSGGLGATHSKFKPE